tara:strand:- start:326 stop:1489 length:1164 start_codon:yes stop_codon:yes gene_type:complete
MIGFGQVNIDKVRLHLFLDYIASSMNGETVNNSLFKAKKALYASDYESYNIDKNAEIVFQGYPNNGNGEYKYVIHNSRVGKYLGIDFDSYSGSFVYTTVWAKNSEKNELNSIFEIDTKILFMRRDMNSEIADDINRKLQNEINLYFKSICTTGTVNGYITNGYESDWGFIDKAVSYEIFGARYINENKRGSIRKNCLRNFDNFAVDLNMGFLTSGTGINEGWSHILHLNFEHKINSYTNSIQSKIEEEINFKVVNPENKSEKIDLRNINVYDLKAMINFFLLECEKFLLDIRFEGNIYAIFETLEGNTIALSYGMNDKDIVIKVDPAKWANSSIEKKWYVLYHELGHDVLNLNHGEGGKMMFNFADRDYSWKEFNDDKKYMFDYLLN